MILNFSHRHRVGSICAPPCPQCNEREGEYALFVLGDNTTAVQRQPLYIVREATREEWVAFVKAECGDTVKIDHRYVFPYFYEVSSD